jgi:hypothetical protein
VEKIVPIKSRKILGISLESLEEVVLEVPQPWLQVSFLHHSEPIPVDRFVNQHLCVESLDSNLPTDEILDSESSRWLQVSIPQEHLPALSKMLLSSTQLPQDMTLKMQQASMLPFLLMQAFGQKVISNESA